MLIDEIPVGASIEIEVRFCGRSMSFNSEVQFKRENSIFINPI